MQTTTVLSINQMEYFGKTYPLKQMIAETLVSAVIQGNPPAGRKMIFKSITVMNAAGVRPNVTLVLRNTDAVGTPVAAKFSMVAGSPSSPIESPLWAFRHILDGPIEMEDGEALFVQFVSGSTLVGFHGQYIEVPS